MKTIRFLFWIVIVSCVFLIPSELSAKKPKLKRYDNNGISFRCDTTVYSIHEIDIFWDNQFSVIVNKYNENDSKRGLGITRSPIDSILTVEHYERLFPEFRDMVINTEENLESLVSVVDTVKLAGKKAKHFIHSAYGGDGNSEYYLYLDSYFIYTEEYLYQVGISHFGEEPYNDFFRPILSTLKLK
jgi:hypothetical protein